MNDAESVSVCVPTYNGEAYLREALQSAVAQTYPHFEVLIVDDGSSDGTLAIANEFAAAYPQVRIVRNSVSKGMVGNWERCVVEAKFPWIKYLFQDDVLHESCLEKMMALCKKHNQLASLCARDVIVSDNAPQDSKNHFRDLVKPEDFFAPGVLPPNEVARKVAQYGTQNILGEPICLLFHKSVLETTGPFDRSLWQLMDFEFLLRCVFTCGLVFTPEPLAQFRVHGASQTSANTPVEEGDAALVRRVRATIGDEILLLHIFSSSQFFEPLRQRWPHSEMADGIRYLYLRSRKKFGKKITDEALKDVYQTVPALPATSYSWLAYKLAKRRYKKAAAERT